MPIFNPQSESVELKAVVWGRVQGVGFRVVARQCANPLGITGSVKNLDDGNVEIIAQGTRDNLERFLSKLKERFASGYIARIDTTFSKPTQSFDQFRIID